MKKCFVIVALGLSLGMAGCVDTSQPWQDSNGQWHSHQVCRQVIQTTSIDIPAGQDAHGNAQYVHVPHQSISTQCHYE